MSSDVAAQPPAEGPHASVSYASLTPISFIERSAMVWGDRLAVCDGERRWTYAEHHDRIRRLIRVLRAQLGIVPGDRVAVLLPNVASMLELHYAVPGAGAVLVPLNTRLAAADYAYILQHSGSRAIFASTSLRPTLEQALSEMRADRPRVIWVDAESPHACEYEQRLEEAEGAALQRPADELSVLSINYTSGTTGRPKGVMLSHRGAYLHSLGVIAEAVLGPRSVYLWTLPMFHCSGWAYTWAVTAAGAQHVCLPRVDPERIWASMAESRVTHLCAAPTVATMMFNAPQAARCERPVRLFVGGSPPAPSLLTRASELGIQVTHLYGLTETYGPLAVCAWNPDWDELPASDQARLRARQGVGTIVTEPLRVVDRAMRDVPHDGQTTGEIVMRGNNVMLGYYDDPDATEKAFDGGWFHSGDLGVVHPDGYIELRDRLKDIVISGGENIATVEIEQALMAHGGILEAAVIGAPDATWGEVPVAYVTIAPHREFDPQELNAFLRERLAHFKVPKRITVVDDLPKTGTGKIRKHVLRQAMYETGAQPLQEELRPHAI